jgi:hypothetical protein
MGFCWLSSLFSSEPVAFAAAVVVIAALLFDD